MVGDGERDHHAAEDRSRHPETVEQRDDHQIDQTQQQEVPSIVQASHLLLEHKIVYLLVKKKGMENKLPFL